MTLQLQYAAVITPDNGTGEFDEDTSTVCELWYSGAGFYVFVSHSLAGELLENFPGTYSECRDAWMHLTGNPLPYEIDRRQV